MARRGDDGAARTEGQPVRLLLGNVAVVEKYEPAVAQVPVAPDGDEPHDRFAARQKEALADLDGRTAKGARPAVRGDGYVTVTRGDLGNRLTAVSVPATSDAAGEVPTRPSDVVALVRALWPFHSDADGPEWVECDDDRFARAIADEFTTPTHECTVGRPDGWRDDGAALAGGSRALDHLWGDDDPDPLDMVLSPGERLRHRRLMVNGGRDALMRLGYDTSRAGLSGGFSFMGLTANTAAVVGTDATLTGEITTAGGGLIRKQAAYAHTNGASTLTLTATFTANGTDALPVTVAKIGLFDAVTAGLMGHAQLLGSTAQVQSSGDSVQVTYTGTLTPS